MVDAVKMGSQWRCYKPRKTNDGAASRIEMKIVPTDYGQDVQLFWVMSPQTGTDANGNASFSWKDGKEDKRSVTMKLGEPDIGELLAVLNGRKESVGGKAGIYHQNERGNTSLTFSYNKDHNLYNVRLARQGTDKKVTEARHSISIGEAEILRIVLESAVRTSYNW